MENWEFLSGRKSQETSNSGSVASYPLASFSFCLHCTEHPGKRPGAESCFSFSAKEGLKHLSQLPFILSFKISYCLSSLCQQVLVVVDTVMNKTDSVLTLKEFSAGQKIYANEITVVTIPM